MATNPGLFTEWPWKRLGNLKYLVLAPWVFHGFWKMATAKELGEMDMAYLGVLPLVFLRVLHSQAWVTISRLKDARGDHCIVDRGIEFQQVDRENNWDDTFILAYLGLLLMPPGQGMPLWRTDGALIMAVMHAGPVEFVYYWFHRALHHRTVYSLYHSHHHASIVTEPISSVIHPFAEVVAHNVLFAIPVVTCILTGTISILAYTIYMFYIDFMNNIGHCNFELVPNWLFKRFPPLKYLVYTPSFHSLHHTQFRTNYSLYMPFYDYIYNTMDKSSSTLYESMLKRKDKSLDVIHLTHLTDLQSVYHLRPGLSMFAARAYNHSNWSMLAILLPLPWLIAMMTWAFSSSPFAIDRTIMYKRLNMKTWAVPRYSFHCRLKRENKAINDLIEKAIHEVDRRGAKVLSLGLLNQACELNGSGELYLQMQPKLRVKPVDGSGLAAAVVANSVASGTNHVVLAGNLDKVAQAVAVALCKRNVKVWIIGVGLEDSEQEPAMEGARFIPCSRFPPRMIRKDCVYLTTPAMSIPRTLLNMHSCENWLPRRVMSAWRIAGIVHALEGWDEHECGDTVLDLDRAWSAAIRHGFHPVTHA